MLCRWMQVKCLKIVPVCTPRMMRHRHLRQNGYKRGRRAKLNQTVCQAF